MNRLSIASAVIALIVLCSFHAHRMARAQGDRGAAEYSARCSTCHGQNLQGTAHGPQLSGIDFKDNWRGRGSALLPLIKATMPPGEAGSLPDITYAEIAGYILRANGIGERASAGDPSAQQQTAAPVTVSPPSGADVADGMDSSRFSGIIARGR
jgi:alcohol dehydrogenase (cytochrome c)